MDEIASFGKWLKIRRMILDLTQAELAQLAGCSTVTIRKIEADERRPSPDLAERLLDYLELPSETGRTFTRAARAAVSPLRLPSPTAHAPLRGALLPLPRTPLLGRSHEVATVNARLLDPACGVVTLTGPGGVGKTRLALEVAAGLRSAFADGVWFVPLASLHAPAQLADAIAQALDVAEQPGCARSASLARFLVDKQLLLVVDNCEHVPDAAPLLADLLAAAPGVRVLATSRAALHLRGEQLVAVPPLAVAPVPPARRAGHGASLVRYASVALFVARAQAVRSSLQLDAAQLEAVAAICRRLDGLPLAIELAAARSTMFAPAALLAQLERRLPLLTGGARDLPARHQTIRATIDWSYQLLAASEQAVFRRLAVFAGSWTRAAAEAVVRSAREDVDAPATCAPGGSPSLLDVLHTLLDHSLIHVNAEMAPDDAGPRFTMMELVREYADELLSNRDEASRLRRRHAAYYLALAEATAREMEQGVAQGQWFARLEAELDNLRVALQWALAQGDAPSAVRLATALGLFWQHWGYSTEGYRWLDAALELDAADPQRDPALRAKALLAQGVLAYHARATSADALLAASQAVYAALGDTAGVAAALGNRAWTAWRQGAYQRIGPLLDAQLTLARSSGNQRGIAQALTGMGTAAYNIGDFPRAFTLLEESLGLRQQLGDQYAIADGYFDLGVAAYYAGDGPRAAAAFATSLTRFEELGDRAAMPLVLIHLAGIAGNAGEYARASRLLDEAEVLSRTFGDVDNALVLRFQGQIARQQHDWAGARAAYGASLRLWQEGMGRKWETAACLEGLGAVAAGQGDVECAARLWGAAAELRAQMGAPLLPVDRGWYEAAVAQSRAMQGAAAFAAAWAQGRAMTLDHAVTYALERIQ